MGGPVPESSFNQGRPSYSASAASSAAHPLSRTHRCPGTGTPRVLALRVQHREAQPKHGKPYDVQDHLASVTDAEGNATTYTHSDRDLLTQQVSPVSGTSVYTYNEHGELATETDARNIVTARTTDALDRVTAVSYPDSKLNTTYTYDTGAFGKGRLTGLTRLGETLASTYDRFGRVLQDGTLAYTWDKNGNRTTIAYPESITATYGHDFADREATLIVQVGANPPLQLVNGATYETFGPLKTLTLGNGLTETRAFDKRYAPSEIRVDGTSPVLDWSYTTDLAGNITGITDLLNAANNRTYAYQDIHYFLTQGNAAGGMSVFIDITHWLTANIRTLLATMICNDGGAVAVLAGFAGRRGD